VTSERSEISLLQLLSRRPHPRALARAVGGAALAVGLERLERRGLVRRIRGGYRLTGRGKYELELRRLLGRALARSR